MDGERISLRLTSKELEMMDDFIVENERFDNRSQLTREAIRRYVMDEVERDDQPTVDKYQDVVLPRLLKDILIEYVDAGEFKSVSDAIELAVRKIFVDDEGYKKVSMRLRETTADRYRMMLK